MAFTRGDGIADSYYREMEVIGSHVSLRRLWINEGKRRGYEITELNK